jgi:hypothetical protein
VDDSDDDNDMFDASGNSGHDDDDDVRRQENPNLRLVVSAEIVADELQLVAIDAEMPVSMRLQPPLGVIPCSSRMLLPELGLCAPGKMRLAGPYGLNRVAENRPQCFGFDMRPFGLSGMAYDDAYQLCPAA